jgi:predicted metal-dependent phosphoesterase TrpH
MSSLHSQKAREVEVKYPRGSEWRKWDLHVHTPESVLNQSFGPDFDAYAKALLKGAIENEIAVIGVTDYWTIEGYKQLRQIVDDDARVANLLGEEDAEKARKIPVGRWNLGKA